MKPQLSSDPTALRRTAEARMSERLASSPLQTEADLRRIQHELEVHQIELEMQNEELRAAKAEIEAGLARYTDLFDFAPVGYFNLTADGSILLGNLTGAKLLGVERGRLLDQRFGLFVAETHRRSFGEFLARVFATGNRQTCVLVLTADGPPLTVHLEATLSPGGNECHAVMLDVTGHEQAEERIRKLSSAAEQAADNILITDREGVIEYVNAAFVACTGYTAAEVAGRTPSLLKSGQHPPEYFQELWRTILSGRIFHGEVINRRKNRELYCEDLRIAPLRDDRGEITHFVATGRDITARMRAEQKVRESSELLRALLARLQRSREEERTRVAREIHDELGQLLTSLKLDVRWLERKLSEPSLPRSLHPLLDRAVSASEQIDATITAVQAIAAELRPGSLDQLGLVAALTQEMRRFAERSGIRGTVVAPEPAPALPAETASELFYICREALTNVARHAQATTVEIRLRTVGTSALLEVGDDGVGIAETAPTAAQSLGLLGMSERAAQCGGIFSVQRNEPRGTRVTVRVPLAASVRRDA